MEREPYDPYYRDFRSNVLPVRSPFTRAGTHDAGHVFIYMTHKRKRWSLLLDKTRTQAIYAEARQRIPRGISQLWLLEKCYSTRKSPTRIPRSSARRNAPDVPVHTAVNPAEAAKTLIVLREPYPSLTEQGDVLSYHLQMADALAAAETYTRLHSRRAIVGLLLWDELWF